MQRSNVAQSPAQRAAPLDPAADRPADARSPRRRALLGLAAAAVVACGAGAPAGWRGIGHANAQAPASAGAAADARTLLILGDSLSAEYGLARGEGWVALLERRLQSVPAGRGWTVLNASISGDTTAGGLTRLPPLLTKHAPAIAVIELGANDALRGLSLVGTEANLRRMVTLAREAGAVPLLVGMMMPPNYGAAYAKQFADLYRRIADNEKIPLVPFLLEGFGDDLSWFQPDRIHPAAKAQPRMLDNVWPTLSPLL